MAGTPLTDAINALTTYSNTVTGASDTTLSDAVATLASGYGGGGGGEPSLPTGYTRMLCLVSSGTQYIDTGLYTKANHEYEVTYKIDANGSINIFGNNLSDGSGAFLQANGNQCYYRFGSANYTTKVDKLNNDFTASDKINIGGFCSYDFVQKNWFVIHTQTSTVTENQSVHNILFGRSTGANSRQLSASRIYRFRCKEGDTYIRDMYPAKRDSDSVLGMYDVVNSVFYTNAGSGTFTASPIV